MSRFNCCECGEEQHIDKLFSIQIFKDSIHWCFDCANKQLRVSDYHIVKLSKKQAAKKYKILKFKTIGGYASFRVRKRLRGRK